MALDRLPELGLTSFAGEGGTIDVATGAHDTVTKIAGVVRQPVTAAMALVQFPPSTLTHPVWISNDVDSCMLLNWDAQSAYLGAEVMADEFLGQGGLANALEGLSAKTEPLIHVKKDILDGITGELMILQGESPASYRKKGSILLALSLKAAEKFDGIVRQLVNQPGSKAGSRTVDATTVAVFDGKKSSTHLVVAHGTVLVSNDTVLLDDVINGAAGDHLVESADFRHLSAGIPAEKIVVLDSTAGQSARSCLRNSEKGGVAVPAGFDLKLLPTFDRIQHHFQPTATWAAPTTDGFQYVSISLPPSE